MKESNIDNLIDNNTNKLNIDGKEFQESNPLKRIIETALAAKLSSDNISRDLKNNLTNKFRDGLNHLD